MQHRLSLLAALVAALLPAACDSRWGRQDASNQRIASALPAVPRPVGPVPGPGDVAPASNPLAGDAQSLIDGRTLFVRFNCSGCHGGRGGGGMGPSLRNQRWRYGGHDSDIFDSIAQGRGQGMPAWGTKLPEQQIWQLVAYIQSLGTANEPAAPR